MEIQQLELRCDVFFSALGVMLAVVYIAYGSRQAPWWVKPMIMRTLLENQHQELLGINNSIAPEHRKLPVLLLPVTPKHKGPPIPPQPHNPILQSPALDLT